MVALSNNAAVLKFIYNLKTAILSGPSPYIRTQRTIILGSFNLSLEHCVIMNLSACVEEESIVSQSHHLIAKTCLWSLERGFSERPYLGKA